MVTLLSTYSVNEKFIKKLSIKYCYYLLPVTYLLPIDSVRCVNAMRIFKQSTQYFFTRCAVIQAAQHMRCMGG